MGDTPSRRTTESRGYQLSVYGADAVKVRTPNEVDHHRKKRWPQPLRLLPSWTELQKPPSFCHITLKKTSVTKLSTKMYNSLSSIQRWKNSKFKALHYGSNVSLMMQSFIKNGKSCPSGGPFVEEACGYALYIHWSCINTLPCQLEKTRL